MSDVIRRQGLVEADLCCLMCGAWSVDWLASAGVMQQQTAPPGRLLAGPGDRGLHLLRRVHRVRPDDIAGARVQ